MSRDSETIVPVGYKAAGNRVFQSADTKRAAEANAYEREQLWRRQVVLVRYASWAFQIPAVSKRGAAARFGGAGAIDAGKHFSVAERNPCWTQYAFRSSLPFHYEVNDRVHRSVTCVFIVAPIIATKFYLINKSCKSKEKLQTSLINIACLNLVVVIILVNKILSLDQSWCSSSSDQDAHQVSLSVQFHFSEHPSCVFWWVAQFITRYLPYLAIHLLSISVHVYFMLAICLHLVQ